MKGKYIKTLLWALCALHGATGCEVIDINTQNPPPGPAKNLFYTTVEYPRGYDWYRDSLGGIVDTRLVLYKDHKQQLSISLTPEEYQTTFTHMHGIFEGDLYSVHCKRGATSFKRNGEALFSIGEEKNLLEFSVAEGNVYSIFLDGDQGFEYRKNSDIVLKCPKAEVMGEMYTDSGQVCFSFRENIGDSGSVCVYRYYYVKGEERKMINPMPMVTEILAARLYKGKLNILQKENGINGMVWTWDENSMVISGGQKMRGYSFTVTSKDIYAHSQTSGAAGSPSSWQDNFWTKGGTKRTSAADEHIVAVCAEPDGDLCFACTPKAAAGPVTLVTESGRETLANNMILMSQCNICSDGARLFVGLTEKESRKPVIYGTGSYEGYPFNGFFTHLDFQ